MKVNKSIVGFLCSGAMSAGFVFAMLSANEASATDSGPSAECTDVDYNSGRIYSCPGNIQPSTGGVVYTKNAYGGSATLCGFQVGTLACGPYKSITSNNYVATSLASPGATYNFPEIHAIMPNRTTATLVGYLIQ